MGRGHIQNHFLEIPTILRVSIMVSVWSFVAPVVGTAVANFEAVEPPSTVIMISLDGTRPGDVLPETLPSLVALAKQGPVDYFVCRLWSVVYVCVLSFCICCVLHSQFVYVSCTFCMWTLVCFICCVSSSYYVRCALYYVYSWIVFFLLSVLYRDFQFFVMLGANRRFNP